MISSFPRSPRFRLFFLYSLFFLLLKIRLNRLLLETAAAAAVVKENPSNADETKNAENDDHLSYECFSLVMRLFSYQHTSYRHFSYWYSFDRHISHRYIGEKHFSSTHLPMVTFRAHIYSTNLSQTSLFTVDAFPVITILIPNSNRRVNNFLIVTLSFVIEFA